MLAPVRCPLPRFRLCPSQDQSSLVRGHLRVHGTPLPIKTRWIRAKTGTAWFEQDALGIAGVELRVELRGLEPLTPTCGRRRPRSDPPVGSAKRRCGWAGRVRARQKGDAELGSPPPPAAFNSRGGVDGVPSRSNTTAAKVRDDSVDGFAGGGAGGGGVNGYGVRRRSAGYLCVDARPGRVWSTQADR
jgi:hypothetical protein